MRDFTRPRLTKPIEFKIDADVFQAVPVLNADMQLKAISLMNRMGTSQLDGITIEKMDPVNATVADVERAKSVAETANNAALEVMTMLDELLLPASAARFAERMKSKTEPIDFVQVIEVFQYLIGQYGDRPTSPSSSSSNGHDGTGNSSTDASPVAGSTPSISPYPAS